MKLKKLAAALTAGTLTLSLAAPALAAEAADARLARVTLAVKAVLDISDKYTEFYGEPDETALGTRWSLSWSSDDEQLQITATDEGKVISLNRWEKSSAEPVYVSLGGRGTPAFPPMTMDEAKTCAQAFLDKVLADNEKLEFEEADHESLSATSYTFRGGVKLNGLASPMSASVRVRLSDGEITRFWRGDVSDYAGDPGPADTSTTAEKAREQLKTTLDMRLEYVLDWDGKEVSEKRAVLRYLPNSTDEFYVDAATGELVNLTELRDKLRRDYAAGGDMSNKLMASAAMDAAAPEAAPTLTPTELEGVAKLEDVLDKDGLDRKIRTWSELGLKNYTLGAASYTVDRDDSSVTARVSYAKNTEEGIYRRNVTVDAKTGELISMYGYGPGRYELQVEEEGKDAPKTITAEAAQAKAAAFLTKLWPEQLAKTETYNGPDGAGKARQWSFTFAQKENGYFFPGNSISAQVDAEGYIVSFSKRFDDDVVFDSADGLIDMEAAVDAWCGSYPVELAYLTVPVALDMREQFELLRNAGYAYYNALKAGYAFGAQDGWCSGVDAKTGEVVREKSEEAEKMAYDDLNGHWAKDILDQLARFNVGWLGGKAEPDKTLIQLDYLKLLASMDGYTVTERDGENGWDWLYDYAYRQGLLTREERAEDEIVTRAGMVKMLLNSLGYGAVAQLPGIFRCGFADAEAIPEADLGYAALAQGLGIISGDGAGNYAPTRTSTRAEAAVLVWNYLKR